MSYDYGSLRIVLGRSKKNVDEQLLMSICHEH